MIIPEIFETVAVSQEVVNGWAIVTTAGAPIGLALSPGKKVL